MSKEEYKRCIKEFLDGITDMKDIKMIYGFARALFREEKKRKAGRHEL